MPTKKQKMPDIRTFLRRTDNPGNSNLASSGGSQPCGARDSQPGGPTCSQQGGARDSQPGGPTRSQQGGARDSQPGGPTRSQQGGAKDSQPGGPTRSQQGGARDSQPGGPTRSQQGGARDSQPGGPTRSQQGRARDSQPGGPTRSQQGGAKDSQPGGATGPQIVTHSQVRVKEENDGDPMGEHLHRFTVKFSPTDSNEYAITCDRPRTVLEAIKSTRIYDKRKKFADENIVIQLGKGDKSYIVATHFPCSCIRDGESVIISCEREIVEAGQDQQYKPIQSRDKYSVFYIDTVGGLYTRQKRLFRNNALRQFKYLVVYGEKGMTVEEALRRDGRFIDNLGDFELSDNENPNCLTDHTQKVDTLDQKEFKICLPREKKRKWQPANEQANQSTKYSCQSDREPTPDVVQQSRNTASNAGAVGQQGVSSVSTVGQQGVSSVSVVGQQGVSSVSAVGQQGVSRVSTVEERSVLAEKIDDYVCSQFRNRKKWMDNQFPGDSYQRTLDLKREDFGKIQSSFSEVQALRKLVELGESVCLLNIDVLFVKSQGTGFVLFDNFILTNAHLFKQCAELQIDNWQKYTKVTARFNYENLDSESKWISFNVKGIIVFSFDELDYAVLELDLEAQNIQVPRGLLKVFGPMPLKGGACLIGHPAGELKKMDPTCIIEKDKRKQAVHDYLYKDSRFIVHPIIQHIKEGIEKVLMSGSVAEKVATYNTFMYHGSSGSPVFDAHGRVFGLHTGGFPYEFSNQTESVIEFAQPLLTIFEHFVSKLRENGDEELLKRVEEEAKGNPFLDKFFGRPCVVKPEPEDPEDHSVFNESMDTD